jgi:hypothetical protein
MTDITFKTGDVDYVGIVLKQNNTGINLTGYTVTFVMKNTATSAKQTITCTQGATISGNSVEFASGGITIPFSSTNTGTAGSFNGEFILSKTSPNSVIHIPSGTNYLTMTIIDAL